MCRQVVVVVLGVLLTIAVCWKPGYCQDATTKIPFEFRAAEVVLPAGSYTISYSEAEPTIVTLRGRDGSTHDVRIITRLAQKEPPSLNSYLAFDKVGDTYLLSEFWLPAMDGFLLGGKPLAHAHVTIKATMKEDFLPPM